VTGRIDQRPLRALLAAATLLLAAGCWVSPEPLTDAERTQEIAADRAEMFAGQEPLQGPLTLEAAFARALKYNLDNRVKMMEEALALHLLDVSRWDMLPRMLTDAGYTTRNSHNAAASEALKTGAQSLVPSFSTDRDWYTTDLTMSWNILDFGVSYYAARQNADRALIAGEHRRKVVANLFEDVRAAFWRMASAEATAAQAKEAIDAAEGALAASRQVEAQRLRPPLQSLLYQRSLLELIRQLEDARQRLTLAKNELAALINLPPGQDFEVALPKANEFDVPKLTTPVAQLEDAALLRNPDLRELSYEQRISADETRKTIVKMLPGINLSVGPQFDSTSFLVHNFWAQGAARFSWNLLNLITLPDQMKYAENSEKLVTAQREALSIATLTKLNIAYQEFVYAQARFARAKETSEVDNRIYEQTRNRAAADAQGTLERISAEVSAVLSELRLYDAYAELEAALGRIYATVGVEPTPGAIAANDIETLTRAIAEVQSQLQQGHAPDLPQPDPQASKLAAPAGPPPEAAPAAEPPRPDQPMAVPAPLTLLRPLDAIASGKTDG